MTREQIVEAMARAAIIDTPHADVCLSVLCGRIPGLSDVLDGKAVIVPREATDEMIRSGHVADPTGSDIPEGDVVMIYRRIWEFMTDASPYTAKEPATPSGVAGKLRRRTRCA